MGSITPATPAKASRLFQPLQLGSAQLSHRVAMAPLTRYRATDDHVPTPLMKEYYVQRASSAPGTLIISEGAFISLHQGGFANAPGIWNEAQVEAWRDIVDAVHAKGGVIFAQLWAIGRSADPEVARREGWVPKTSSAGAKAVTRADGSAIEDGDDDGDAANADVQPQEMTREDIQDTIREYVVAARNAVEGAGFDGVEIHAANGYLIDQFTQDVVNTRTDEYGGSVANRSRFAAEVAAAVAGAVGGGRVGIRFSPFSPYNGMGMGRERGTEQFADVIRRVGDRVPDLAYFHLVEPRIAGNADVESSESLDFAFDRKLWGGALLVAGGHTPDSARRLVDERHRDRDVVVVFGRSFIANPDLPYRIREGIELAPWHRPTFYVGGAKGYTDYPFTEEFRRESLKA